MTAHFGESDVPLSEDAAEGKDFSITGRLAKLEKAVFDPNDARKFALEMAIRALPMTGPAGQCEQAEKYYQWLSAKWLVSLGPVR